MIRCKSTNKGFITREGNVINVITGKEANATSRKVTCATVSEAKAMMNNAK